MQDHIILNLIQMLGGLALFLFGMHQMSSTLERASGSRLSSVLEKLTHNAFSCVLCGLFVTAIMQSSGATTVAVVGLVNAGILPLSSAIYVIMGANIGTTITPWILSLSGIESGNVVLSLFKNEYLGPILAIAGVFILLYSKKQKRKTLGNALIGIGMLFIGLGLMAQAMKPIAALPGFAEVLTVFNNPLFGVLIGALVTALIASSAASVGILQTLAASGSITIGMALPIVLGQNIGTCVNSLIAGVGANRNAKRAGFFHLLFNLFGTALFLIAFFLLRALLPAAAQLFDIKADSVSIALIHTIFNVVSTIILLPFAKLLVKLSERVVRDKKAPEDESCDRLDDRFLNNPAYALVQVNTTMADMATLSCENLKLSLKLLTDYSDEIYETVEARENAVDRIEDRVGAYAVKLNDQPLSPDESKTVSKILHAVNDFERICDHSINIAQIARQAHEEKVVFSNSARDDLDLLSRAINEILDITLAAFLQNDLVSARRVEPLEQVIDEMENELRDRHVERLKAGQCAIGNGILFLDFLGNAERVADHCSNIAIVLTELEESRLDSHEYAKELHEGSDAAYSAASKEFTETYLAPLQKN